MAWQNPKTNWILGNVPAPSDFNRIEEDIRILGQYNRAPGYAVATGSVNTYAVSLDPAPTSYYDGMCIAIKINANNTGASTLNVNGLGPKTIKKTSGNDVSAGILKAGIIYTLRYNGTNFILQGEGGEYGNVSEADVLSGTIFGTENGLSTGTMPNKAGIVNATGAAQWGDGALAVYMEGGSYNWNAYSELKVSQAQLQAAEPDLISTNFLATKNIFGIQGGIISQAAGHYLSPEFGCGDYSGEGYPSIYLRPQRDRYYDNTTDFWIRFRAQNHIPSNIRAGVDDLGVIGTLVPLTTEKKWAQGSYFQSSSFNSMSFSGVGFTPSIIVFRASGLYYFYIPYLPSQFSSKYWYMSGETINMGTGISWNIFSGGATCSAAGMISGDRTIEWFAIE